MSNPINYTSNIEHVTFGVELETIIPVSAPINVGAYHCGISVRGSAENPAPAFNGANWKAEEDGSIAVNLPAYRKCEFVSPILKGEAGVTHLIAWVEWLNAIGAKVNSSTGCHVHIGLAPFSPDAKEQAR